jgi:hypothetical protein
MPIVSWETCAPCIIEKVLSNPARARYPDVHVPVLLISQLDSIIYQAPPCKPGLRSITVNLCISSGFFLYTKCKTCACTQIFVNCYGFSNGRIIFVFPFQISVFNQIFAMVTQLEYPRLASIGKLCLIQILQLNFQRLYFCFFSVGKIRSCPNICRWEMVMISTYPRTRFSVGPLDTNFRFVRGNFSPLITTFRGRITGDASSDVV